MKKIKEMGTPRNGRPANITPPARDDHTREEEKDPEKQEEC